MTDQDREIIGWLKHKIDYYGRYHDHKETMAWGVTALYLPTAISFAFVSRSIRGDECTIKLLFSLFFLVTLGLVSAFACWQFKRRGKAAINVTRLNEALDERIGHDFRKGINLELDDESEYIKSEYITYGAIFFITIAAILIVCLR